MPREVQHPTEKPDSHHGKRIEHPAFATVRASRVSGSADLFGSHVEHQHYIVLSIGPGHMLRDGYDEVVYPSGDRYIEVAMTESQFVGMIGSMNHGSGVPCTLQRWRDPETGKYRAIPGLPPQRKLAERSHEQVDEMTKTMREDGAKARETLRALLTKLPKKDQAAAEQAMAGLGAVGARYIDFHEKCLRETAEHVVNEARVELDATLTYALHGLGLKTTQQLGAVMAADPQALFKMLAHQPEGEE